MTELYMGEPIAMLAGTSRWFTVNWKGASSVMPMPSKILNLSRGVDETLAYLVGETTAVGNIQTVEELIAPDYIDRLEWLRVIVKARVDNEIRRGYADVIVVPFLPTYGKGNL